MKRSAYVHWVLIQLASISSMLEVGPIKLPPRMDKLRVNTPSMNQSMPFTRLFFWPALSFYSPAWSSISRGWRTIPWEFRFLVVSGLGKPGLRAGCCSSDFDGVSCVACVLSLRYLLSGDLFSSIWVLLSFSIMRELDWSASISRSYAAAPYSSSFSSIIETYSSG